MDEGPDLNGVTAYQTLVQRRNWLKQRIKAKLEVGWDVEYDQREHDALCWVLEIKLRPEAAECGT